MTYSCKTRVSFFTVFKEYAEFQYRRRHRQRRRGDMSSLRSNTPDPDDPGENNLGMTEDINDSSDILGGGLWIGLGDT